MNAIRSEKWFRKIFKIMGNYIGSVGFSGLNIKFKPPEDELKNIKDNLAFYLSDLVSEFKDKDGLFIVIDDINGCLKHLNLLIGIKVLQILWQLLLKMLQFV